MSIIHVRDVDGQALPRINIRISEGDLPSDAAIFDVFTDLAGNTGWPIPHWPPPSNMPQGHYTLHVNTANVDTRFQPRSVTKSHDDNATIVLERAPVALSRLHVWQHLFYDEHNARVFIAGHTDFLLYKKWLDGEDLGPLLAERAALGSNCARIIGMVNSFAHWYPQEYGQRYYDGIPAFCRLLEAYGLYVYWTVFADTEIVMPKKAEQLAHFDSVVAQLRQCQNTLGELVNEPYAHENATADPLAFARPQGVPFSSGSYNDVLGDKVTPPPHWDFHDFHVPRKDVKRVADQCMSTNPNYRAGMAVASGESDKFGGPNSFNPKVYLTNPEEARQMAQTAKGTACMYIYHTSGGVWSLPWNETEHRCAAATFARE